MKRICLVVVSFALLACSGNSRIRRQAGSGVEDQRSEQLSSFTKVQLDGAYEAHVVVGEPARIDIYGDDDLIHEIDAEVHDGTLAVIMPRHFEPRLPVTVQIMAPELTAFENNGATRLEISGIDGKHLDLELNGAGRTTVAGRVDHLQIEMSGANRVDTTDLVARQVDVELNGSGKADVKASDRLRAEINGTGRVRYEGGPDTVVKEVNGIGSVRPR
ncbi:MAG: head GIN domain-containing protein [Myxococcota bacterium]